MGLIRNIPVSIQEFWTIHRLVELSIQGFSAFFYSFARSSRDFRHFFTRSLIHPRIFGILSLVCPIIQRFSSFYCSFAHSARDFRHFIARLPNQPRIFSIFFARLLIQPGILGLLLLICPIIQRFSAFFLLVHSLSQGL